MVIEAPQSFIVREECQKAATQNGFRRPKGEVNGWAAFDSTSALGTIQLAAAGTIDDKFKLQRIIGVYPHTAQQGTRDRTGKRKHLAHRRHIQRHLRRISIRRKAAKQKSH